jgi:predicted RNase H-like nuclease (RuvC/YqgF family)
MSPTGVTQQSAVQSKASHQASDNKTETPAERTFTQEEFNKTQSNFQKQIRDLQASLRAEQKKNTELADTVESLTDSVSSLQSEVDSQIPEDSKEYRQKLIEKEKSYEKKLRDFNKSQKEWEFTLAEANLSKREAEANALAVKFGVDVNELLALDDPKEMKVYAVDHFDPAKLKVEPKVEQVNPPPLSQQAAGGDNWHNWSAEDKIKQGLSEIKK